MVFENEALSESMPHKTRYGLQSLSTPTSSSRQEVRVVGPRETETIIVDRLEFYSGDSGPSGGLQVACSVDRLA